jgi:MFS family permease
VSDVARESPTILSQLRLLFGHRNYKLIFLGQLTSNCGTWAQRIAQDWLVLQLSDNNGVALGWVVLLQTVPVILLGLWGGRRADRYSKRTQMAVCQACLALAAAGVGILVISGEIRLWHLFVFAALLGTATAFDQPARQAYLIQLTGPAHLPVAVSLSVSAYNVAAFLGPTVAGLSIASFGLGAMFIVNAFSYVVMLICIFLVRRDRLYPLNAPTKAAERRHALGITYARTHLTVILPIVIVMLTASFGQGFQVVLPLLVRQRFDLEVTAYAALMGALAVGALLGAIVSIKLGGVRVGVLVGAACVFGALLLAVAATPNYALLLVTLVPVGVATSVVASAANAMVQLSTAPDMRGRVLSLYMLVLLTVTSLGSLLHGGLSQWFGGQWSIAIGGAVVLLGCPLVAGGFARRRGLTMPALLDTAVRRVPHDRHATKSKEPA